MKYYLSSYRLGSEENQQEFKKMISITNKKVAYIPNALDFSTNPEKRKIIEDQNQNDLKCVGLDPEKIDLKEFFNKKEELEIVLKNFDIIFVSGGNTFVLLQAMKLSGFDEILKSFAKENKDIIYAGYSAGICVLGPSLEGLSIVDDPNHKPYGEEHETIWDGLGILEYTFAPHYKSDHPESADIDKEIELMIDKKMLFKALRDGEVIIIE